MRRGTPPDPSVVKEPTPVFPVQELDSEPKGETLGLSEAGLRLALEAGDLGGWEWEIGTGTVRWSENLERIHGLEPGSFGRTFEAYQALIHPEDRDRVMGSLRGC